MIAIEHVLLSDEVVMEEFVCDLHSCKGGCCVDGDCGAPITEEEAREIARDFAVFQKYLPQDALEAIAAQGLNVQDKEHGTVTPTVAGGICAFGYHDERGIVKCAIERAYNAGEIPFKKPISCHLFPFRIISNDGYEAVNYEPRESLCSPACRLGEKLKVPVYQFLKEPLIRKYGEEFYETLDAVAGKMRG